MLFSSKLINYSKCCSPVHPLISGRWTQVTHGNFKCFHEVNGNKSVHSLKRFDLRSNFNCLETIQIRQLSKKFNDNSQTDKRSTVKNNKSEQFISLSQMETEIGQNDEINKRIWTIPNGLCLFRILVSPIVAYTIINNQPVASVAICIVAGLSDFADGFIARRYESQKSTLGSIIDPVADKILVTTLFLSTAISGQLPVLLASIVIGRDLILILGAAFKRYQLMSQPRTLLQFFNLKGLNMEVKSSMISKWNTTFQFTLISLTIASPILNISDSIFLIYFQYLVATTTIASGVDYIFNRDKYISSLKRK
ncbi:probable cardiolipin synthase (CMP-forming) [Panonychus citri]|uniref:probable cardiolipin synthase (CMP-forming) n=1 Tax=Panonychus citri TaxID=50023 RepID=UPI002307CC9E|nr:probable cardiolipin synthase (CMP-forming) [Panonychus citri]